jgi:hypothetical protein
MARPIWEIELNAFADLLTIDHPAFSQNTVLVTRPISELYQIVRHVLLVRESGCCFTAPSGVGKTRALILLEHLLRERMPQLVIVRHSSWNHQVPSIRAFFKHFLTAVGHAELRGETFDLRHRLVRRLIDLARVSQLPFVVLLIDEANAMRIEDFLFLKDIYNDLDRENVQLVTILMGQDPDFSNVINNLRDKGKSDLISRFARRRQAFRAFDSEEDVAAVFKQYDTSVWPAGTSQTWTQYFMPSAWELGFRLENETAAFFEAVKNCLPYSVQTVDFPARQFFTTLRRYLTVRHHLGGLRSLPKDDLWADAVDFALLADAMAEMKGEAKRAKGNVT